MLKKILKKKPDAMQFTDMLLSLVQSGLSLNQALKALSAEDKESNYASFILKKIENGEGFTSTLCSMSKKFNDCRLILEPAEESGDIATALKLTVEELTQKKAERQNLITAIIYPFFICLLSVSLCFFMMIYGIDYINQIAFVSKKEILGGIAWANIWLMFSGSVTALVIRFFSTRHDFAWAVFQGLYFLNLSGKGMEEAFVILLREKGFSKKELKCIALMLRKLRDGTSFSNTVRESKAFDLFSVLWLGASEKSGNIREGLLKVYENYRVKRKKARENTQRFLEPVLNAVCGVYIIILIASCIIPVFLSLGENIF